VSRFPYRPLFFLAALLALGIFAAAVTIPNVFSAGEIIRAEEVNANFQALKAEVEAAQARIASLEANRVVASASNASFGTLSTGPSTSVNVESVEITLPSDGVVVVQATGWLNLFPGTGGVGDFFFGILDTDLGGGPTGLIPGMNVFDPGDGVTGLSQYPMATQRVFRKEAGTHTFYAVGVHNTGIGASADFAFPVLTATFFPDAQATGVAAAQLAPQGMRTNTIPSGR
jgi:hypothetical protein